MMHCAFIDESDIYTVIPLLLELDPHLPEALLKSRLDAMVAGNYQCVGLYDNGTLVGICGIWVLVKYYVGKHLEVDNVVIRPAYRGRTFGQMLLHYVEAYARSIDCLAIELNCYIHNAGGNHFWEAEGFTQIGNHFQKKL